MSNLIIVRINDQLIPDTLIRYNPSDNVAKSSTISNWDEINVDSKDRLILFLSANMVFSTEVKIPSKNDEIISQSIPFTIEEKIATDIDLNHFAYKKHINQNVLVSVISKIIIEKILSQLKQHNLLCYEVYSELYSCPNQKGMTSLCVFDNYCIVRDDANGTTLNHALLDNYLALSQSKKIVQFSEKDLKINNHENVLIKKINLSALQAQTIDSGDAVNLLQGQYEQRTSKQKSVNPVKKLGILICLLISSWLFINGYKIWELSNDIRQLKESQKSLFQKIAPNANSTELNDPYSAMLSRLKLTNTTQNNNNKQGFIQALIYLGTTLNQIPEIEITSLRQRNTKLEVNLKANNAAQLNQFQQSLEKNAFSMRVRTGTRNSTQDGFTSIITMEQL